jgi:hypothetical protein
MLKFEPKGISIPRYSSVFALPERSIVFTNSERRSSWCERKWYFKHKKEYASKIEVNNPMVFGRVFHELMEDVHKHWMLGGNKYTDNLFKREGSPWNDIKSSLKDEFGYDLETKNKISEIMNNAKLAVEGYLKRFGNHKPPNWDIVAVEEELCFPIITPNGKPFRSKLYIYDDGVNNYRLAKAGDDSKFVKKVVLPWFHIAKLDFIAQDKVTGDFYVGEMKTSSYPAGYLKNLAIDTQISAYSMALMHAINNGWCESKNIKRGNVKGYIYEVTYSGKHIQPKVLKPKKDSEGNEVVNLSKDKRSRIFSWDYRDAVLRNNLKLTEYQEHIDFLKQKVDENFYLQELDFISSERVMSFILESYRAAVKFSMLHVAAYTADSDIKVELEFPRTTLCRARMFCEYDGICSLPVSQTQFQQSAHRLEWVRSN